MPEGECVMFKLANGPASRRTIGVLATALAVACAVPSSAETGAPAVQSPGPAMGAMKQEMMQQMQQCMDQMPPMTSTDPKAMRQQMMERMHSCMEGMMDASGTHHCSAMKVQSAPGQAEELKPDAHDHSGKDAEPGH
jgi:hypothetical protein